MENFERVFENLCSMMKDRDLFYEISEEMPTSPNGENDVIFQARFSSGQKDSLPVDVFFVKDIKIDKNFYTTLETLASRMERKSPHFIFILDTIEKKELPKDNSRGIRLEIFSKTFFYYSLSTPFPRQYCKTSEKEAIDLIKNYGPSAKFPFILSNDRVVRWLGLDVGDVLKITRPSVTFPYYMKGDEKVDLMVPDYRTVVDL